MKFLSWNIALCDLSISSPPNWTKNETIYNVQKIIEDENPDIFTLQEMPSENFPKRFGNYVPSEIIESHSGYTGIMLRDRFKIINQKKIATKSKERMFFNDESIVIKVRDTKNELQDFFVAGCHLHPFNQFKNVRFSQILVLLEFIKNNAEETFQTIPIIIAGDMNMRETETIGVVNNLNLIDAYLKCGTPESKYTWDTYKNAYYLNGEKFRARFDRIFLKNINCSNFRLIGNNPISDRENHFLSDHFGVSIELLFDKI